MEGDGRAGARFGVVGREQTVAHGKAGRCQFATERQQHGHAAWRLVAVRGRRRAVRRRGCGGGAVDGQAATTRLAKGQRQYRGVIAEEAGLLHEGRIRHRLQLALGVAQFGGALGALQQPGAFGERGGHAEAVASGVERSGAQGQPVGHPPGGHEGAVLLQQGEGLRAATVVQGKAGGEQVVAELVLRREAPARRLDEFSAGARGIPRATQ